MNWYGVIHIFLLYFDENMPMADIENNTVHKFFSHLLENLKTDSKISM